MNIHKFIFFLALGFILPSHLSAKHLVGGTLTYRLLSTGTSQNNYEITLDVFRDCNSSTQFDGKVYIGIFKGDTKGSVGDLTLFQTLEEYVQPVLDSCVKVPPDLCYQHAVYKGIKSLPIRTSGYYLTWERCCRNNTILNIKDPEGTGMALYAFIPDLSIQNSTPVFNVESYKAKTFVCAGLPYIDDMSANGKDSVDNNHPVYYDSLIYELTAPLTGGTPDNPQPGDPNGPGCPGNCEQTSPPPYPTVIWQNPYNLNNILGGTPALSINRFTGIITGYPQQIGQFVYSVLVSEYRNGKLLSQVRRDIQVNVVQCPVNVPPQIASEPSSQISGDTLIFYAGEETCFNFDITDVNMGAVAADRLTIDVDGDLLAPGGNGFVAPFATFTAPSLAYSPINASLCWFTDCKQIGEGEFHLKVSDENKCPSKNITEKTYFFKVLPGRATAPNVRCVSVTGANEITVTWKNPTANKLRGFTGYILERNDGTTWSTLAIITDSLQTTFIDATALNANTKSYCYRLATSKICPNPFVGTTGTEACSMIATATPITSVQALVEWAPPYKVWSPSDYNVWAFETGLTPLKAATVRDSTNYTFLGCTFDGYLQIRLQDPLTGCQVYSGISNSISLLDLIPADIDLCVASVSTDDSGIDLNWDKFIGDDFLYYRIYRAEAGSSNFTMIKEINDLNVITYKDASASVDKMSYCYYIEKSDLCGNVQRTGTDCSMHIGSAGEEYQIYLKWNNYIGWQPAANNVELWETKDGITQNLVATFGSGTTATIIKDVVDSKAVYCYKVKSIRNESNACYEAWSNETCVSFPPTLYFPNAFTPNGDGDNDTYSAVGIYAKSYDLYIYNRWGTLVFHTQSQEQGWDGTINGVPAPEGAYVFRAKVIGYEDEVIQKTGTVTLIR